MEVIQYLLVGLPFSGKTTLSKKLERSFEIPRVSLDEVKFELGFEGVSDNEISHEDWTKIFNETDQRVVFRLLRCAGCGRAGLAGIHGNMGVDAGTLVEFFPRSIT